MNDHYPLDVSNSIPLDGVYQNRQIGLTTTTTIIITKYLLNISYQSATNNELHHSSFDTIN